jgi:TPR repeat protein
VKNIKTDLAASSLDIQASKNRLHVSKLEQKCSAKDIAACFELGGHLTRNEQYEKAINPYMTACTLGHANSCYALGNVQSILKSKEDRKLRLHTERKELLAKEETEKLANQKAWLSTFDLLDKMHSPKYRCTSKTNAAGETVTECMERVTLDRDLL